MVSQGGWSAKFPVYQIDFAAAASGKRVAATKRRVRWRFGFPNKRALDDGQTGTECRGEEHDVVVVWSLTSGKRQISMDGKEIHYSTNRAGMLDFSWTSRGNHVIKVICHAAPPLSATPGFRQYDLLIDGQSFFTMPKVYELGIKGPIPSHARVPGYAPSGYSNPTSPITMGSGFNASQARSPDYGGPGISAPVSRAQEDDDLRKAINASIEESRLHLGSRGASDNTSSYSTPNATAGTADLLDFAGPSPAQPPADARSVSSMPSYYSAPPSYNQAPYQSPSPVPSNALVPAVAPPGYYGAPPPPAPAYASPPPTTPSYGAPPPANLSFASPAPTTPGYTSPPPVPPAPAPSPAPYYPPQRAAADMLSTPNRPPADAFGLNSGPEDDPFAPKAPPPPSRQDFANQILGAYANTPATPAATPQQNGVAPHQSPQAHGFCPQGRPTPITMQALVGAEEEPEENEFDSVLKKLVNVDRIDEPAAGKTKLTMMREEEKQKKPKGKSKPLPPVAHGMIGSGATLEQIKSVNPHHGQPRTVEEGKIMKAPPPGLFQQGVAYSGALVVHGQGPPPLQQPSGFGVGASLPNGGFRSQQQALPMGYYQQR